MPYEKSILMLSMVKETIVQVSEDDETKCHNSHTMPFTGCQTQPWIPSTPAS